MSLADYAASLTGQRLREVLAGADESVYVNAAIPKFSAEYGAELQKALGDMGMADAFDREKADFSRLGTYEDGNLYIGRLMHKTFIHVDEKGTEAGAATAVEVRAAGMLGPEEQIHLDRPFLYMLIDYRYKAPLFIGAVVFLGDSITEYCDLALYYPGVNAVNEGIAGDTTGGMLERMERVYAAKPRIVVVSGGINDLFSGIDAE